MRLGTPGATRARIPSTKGEPLDITPHGVRTTRLLPGDASQEWTLRVPYRKPLDIPMKSWAQRAFGRGGATATAPEAEFTGEDAVRTARHLLPKINAYGGSRSKVRDAVDLVERSGSAERCFAAAARVKHTWSTNADPYDLRTLPAAVRLALEMSAHEEVEKQALEGELAELEQHWQEAEEIAAISDRLLLPPKVADFIRRHRGG